jgi:glycosyltransferase involved in cell wall biosynthesis
MDDDIVEVQSGDILVTLDLSGNHLQEAENSGLYADYRRRGVRMYSVIYDLLPLQMPHYFPPGAADSFLDWIQVVCQWDGGLCISKTVAKEFQLWMQNNYPERVKEYLIKAFTLGGDLEKSAPTYGLPSDLPELAKAIKESISFLMVGTVEPRKGYLQTIEAFNHLWDQGEAVNLIIVGKLGWSDLPNSQRRTIPTIEKALRNHPLKGSRLFWFESASDEFLGWLYQNVSALIAASEGEGFGLPLIEAAQNKLPIIARDIEVFREVARGYASYFKAQNGVDLAKAIKVWADDCRSGKYIDPAEMSFATWGISAQQFIECIIDEFA